MSQFEVIKARIITSVPVKPLCLPDQAQNALDTFKLWSLIVAGAMAVVTLIFVGVGWWFEHKRGDGGAMMKSLLIWIGGAVLVAIAAGVAAAFIPSGSTDCVKTLNG
ncbi:hypothetical protein ABH924_004614 [Arthrobacter sp. GAS37]|uniref:hypothetical protein n=1 Tax=Arthrobacter sp. GAS37 TaxID=3156261 RepID=UPI00383628B7